MRAVIAATSVDESKYGSRITEEEESLLHAESSTKAKVEEEVAAQSHHRSELVRSAWVFALLDKVTDMGRRNQKETLSQNYRRLGLASKLNAIAGGTEKSTVNVPDSDEPQKPRASGLGVKSRKGAELQISEVRVERDPETGAILQVIESGDRRPNPLNDPLNDLEDSEEEEWNGFREEHDIQVGGNSGQTESEVVRRLQLEASRPTVRRVRKQSDREEEWITALVDKYGDDYGKMSRDMKLNPMQQSVGDLKRRIVKWKKAHAGNV